jgi:hypothetical protein
MPLLSPAVRRLRSSAVFTALLCACGPALEGDDADDLASQESPITANEIMARADDYMTHGILYCGGPAGGQDLMCGNGICHPPSGPWSSHRSDCSGFVSYCWQISSDPDTRTYVNDMGGSQGWGTIGIDQLRPGDAVVTVGHIKLFGGFLGSNSALIYEQYDCGKTAHKEAQFFSRSGNTMWFGGDDRSYHPIRRNGLSNQPGVNPPPPSGGGCGVQGDGRLHCTNTAGAAMYSASNPNSGIVNHLRSTYSWFDCFAFGAPHSGGNSTWYHTLGDDNGNWGFVPAVSLQTSSAFDGNPAAAGLKQCAGSAPPAASPTSPTCNVHSDGRLYCTNSAGAPIYATESGGAIVNHLRTTSSWFDCFQFGAPHSGGNSTWYHTIGDDNGNWGYVPAVHLSTNSAFDANPAAGGLRRCN